LIHFYKSVISEVNMEERVNAVFDLFAKWGHENYIGEKVTQAQHAQQAAEQAKAEGHPPHVLVGALLHDIGHLVGLERGLPAMTEGGQVLGTAGHERVGEEFLEGLGFPKEVTQFVRGHVQAKRYLVFKNPSYHDCLSEASKGTLVCQGGPMTKEEAECFEALPAFSAILAMRDWDDKAKDPSKPVSSMEPWKEMARELMA